MTDITTKKKRATVFTYELIVSHGHTSPSLTVNTVTLADDAPIPDDVPVVIAVDCIDMVRLQGKDDRVIIKSWEIDAPTLLDMLLQAAPHKIGVMVLDDMSDEGNARVAAIEMVLYEFHMRASWSIVSMPRVALAQVSNLGLMHRYRDARQALSAFINVPWLVVASGPSLAERTIGLVRHMQKYCVVAAVDSSIQALVENNIKPDVFVCLENCARKRRFSDFVTGQTDMAMACMTHTSQTAIRRTQLPLAMYSGHKQHIAQIVNEHRPGTWTKLDEDPSGFSVTNLAVAVALHHSPSPCFIVGHDLSLTDGHTHHEWSMDEDKPVPENPGHEAREVDAIGGGTVVQPWLFGRMAGWYSELRHDNQKRIVNLTRRGAIIPGIHHRLTPDMGAPESLHAQRGLFRELLKEAQPYFSGEDRRKAFAELRWKMRGDDTFLYLRNPVEVWNKTQRRHKVLRHWDRLLERIEGMYA